MAIPSCTYETATDYRKMFRCIGYQIMADHATRQGDGEVHLVLIWDIKRDRFGFILTHDNYDSTYAPMFCEDGDIDWFRLCLEERIRWFDCPQDIYDFFFTRPNKERFWLAHRVGRSNPKLVQNFLADIKNLLIRDFGVFE